MPSLCVSRHNDCEASPDDQALINRCRLQLFEAGADPSLYQEENPGHFSFIRLALEVGTTVLTTSQIWKSLLIEMKESIKMLLDHGLHYVQTASTVKAQLWLKTHLESYIWVVGSIALLLRRQGKNGLPIQQLEGCLHRVILGSYESDEDGLREALIILIRAGADVYAKDRFGRSVSYMACCTGPEWRLISMNSPAGWRLQDNDLRLRDIWTEALSACGFDAEEVMSTSMCLEELSDSDNDSMSDQHVESDSAESDCSENVVNNSTSLISEIDNDNDSMSDQHEESDFAESDCSENVVNNPTSLISEIGSPENHYNDTFWQTDSTLEAAAQIDAVRQTDSAFANQYEQSLSEGDAQINTPWQTDSTFADQYDLSLLEGDAQIWGNWD